MNGPIMRNASTLALTVLLAFLALMLLERATRSAIESGHNRYLQQQLKEVIPSVPHDNDIVSDVLKVDLEQPITVYPLFSNGKLVAIAAVFNSPPAYNGPLQVLAGIKPDGSLTGVRVVEHRETPGLGDVVDGRGSDWINAFTNLAHDADFDHVSGATITTSTLIRSVQHLDVEALFSSTQEASEQQP